MGNRLRDFCRMPFAQMALIVTLNCRKHLMNKEIGDGASPSKRQIKRQKAPFSASRCRLFGDAKHGDRLSRHRWPEPALLYVRLSSLTACRMVTESQTMSECQAGKPRRVQKPSATRPAVLERPAHAVSPPSTTNTWPVTNEASSEAR